MKILIADDDPAVRRILEAILLQWGHEVTVACDGNEALKVLRKHNAPTFAILDWMMPGMDGPQICREVRKRTPTKAPHIYIVLLSSKNSLEDIIAGLDSGADDYIAKPIEPEKLRMRLDNGRRIVELIELSPLRLETNPSLC